MPMAATLSSDGRARGRIEPRTVVGKLQAASKDAVFVPHSRRPRASRSAEKLRCTHSQTTLDDASGGADSRSTHRRRSVSRETRNGVFTRMVAEAGQGGGDRYREGYLRISAWPIRLPRHIVAPRRRAAAGSAAGFIRTARAAHSAARFARRRSSSTFQSRTGRALARVPALPRSCRSARVA